MNKKRTSYVICDGLTRFYYRYVFRYLSQRSVLDPGTFYDRYVNDDFEQQFVPHAFEEVCKQYLVRQNRAGNIEPPFDLIGTYSYDDLAARTNGEFDVVTRDPLGYAFYEAKLRSTPVTQRMIDEEIEQCSGQGLRATGTGSSRALGLRHYLMGGRSSSGWRRCTSRPRRAGPDAHEASAPCRPSPTPSLPPSTAKTSPVT